MFEMSLYEEKFKNIEENTVYLCQNNSDKPYIVMNDKTTYNNNENYFVINGKYAGGTLVMFPNDIVLTWVTRESLWQNFGIELMDFLKNNGVRFTKDLFDGNDIMINEKKIIGTTSKKIGEYYYEGLFFSFNPDINIIKSICEKEMKKEPIGFSEFNITPETIIDFCKQFIKKYELKEI